MSFCLSLIKNYGISGLFLYLKIRFSGTDRLNIPSLRHPLSLRKGTSDIATFKQIFVDQEYEISYGFTPKVIIDAGANIGLAACFLINKFPKSTIVSIEPELNNFEQLSKNVQHYEHVHPLKMALSNVEEKLDVIDNNQGNWGFITTNKDDGLSQKVVDSIDSITVSGIMAKYNLQHIDILKVDIEGYEKELFESNYEEWIPKTRCIIIELHDRFKKGCSTSLFNCILKYDFTFHIHGENAILINNDFSEGK